MEAGIYDNVDERGRNQRTKQGRRKIGRNTGRKIERSGRRNKRNGLSAERIRGAHTDNLVTNSGKVSS